MKRLVCHAAACRFTASNSAYSASNEVTGRMISLPQQAGKLLPVTATEVIVKLRPAPAIFADLVPPANMFRFRVTPEQTIAISSFVKLPGERLRGESVELVVSQNLDPVELVAYEELLNDALQGESGRFARQDYVEESWRIVDPVLDDATPVYEYAPGTWGPAEAARVEPEGGWVNPMRMRESP